jgi:hypothetical protein
MEEKDRLYIILSLFFEAYPNHKNQDWYKALSPAEKKYVSELEKSFIEGIEQGFREWQKGGRHG